MSYLRFSAVLLLAALTIGCKAQTKAPASGSQLTALQLNRRIEILVRSQYDLSPDVGVSLGARTPSKFPGYQTLPVTLSRGSMSQKINFLISDDNTKLLHVSTMDLTKDPADLIDIAGRPIRGNPDAKVTVVNFDDLECPYCARMNAELFPATLDHYKNDVRFIYKDDPLTQLHPWAMHAAVDANCLAAQSGPVYWQYVDYLHNHDSEITGTTLNLPKSYAALDSIARQEGAQGKLDSAKLDACLAKQDETTVLKEQKEAESLNIEGTPALFVDGERIAGAVPRVQLWAAIDRALRARGITPPPEEQPATPQKAAPAAASGATAKK